MFDDYVLAHDEAVGGHFAEFGQDAVDVLVSVDERDHNGKLASGLDEVGGVDFVTTEESGNGMEGDSSEHVFFTQVFQYFQMQGAMMPGIAFGQIDGDLNRHNVNWLTTPVAILQRPGEGCASQNCG